MYLITTLPAYLQMTLLQNYARLLRFPRNFLRFVEVCRWLSVDTHQGSRTSRASSSVKEELQWQPWPKRNLTFPVHLLLNLHRVNHPLLPCLSQADPLRNQLLLKARARLLLLKTIRLQQGQVWMQ